MPSPDPPSGGTQRQHAVFGQIAFDLSQALTATAGARAGVWRTRSLDSSGDDLRGTFAPRASVAWRASPRVALHLTATKTARTPTLNELHRDFRVGNVLTSANPELEPEDARTVEGGALWNLGGVSARVLGFWTRLDGAVTNVTLSPPGAPLILRQRRNAGAIRARGLESELEWRPRRSWSVTGSLAVLDSVFTGSDEPGLAGRRVPQVPRWQAGTAATYAAAAGTATVEWRSAGAQFDDDRNQFVLGSGHLLNAYVSARAGALHPFVAIENVLDAEIDVGRTPVRTLGLPRTWRAGLRLTLP
jgi:outer membrane receptor protein involved in Fe transport